MNLKLIHGGDFVRSHQKILEIKKSFDPLSIVELKGEGLDIKTLDDSIKSISFFSSQRLILIDNPPTNFKFSEIPKIDDVTLVFIFSKDLPLSSEILEDAKSCQSDIFYFPKKSMVNIFSFLDLVIEEKKDAVYRLEQVYAEYGAQYLLTMLTYSLRRLILPSKSSSKFAMEKQEKQKKSYSLEKIKKLYELILDLDFKIKSGMIDEKLALSLLVHNFQA